MTDARIVNTYLNVLKECEKLDWKVYVCETYIKITPIPEQAYVLVTDSIRECAGFVQGFKQK